MLIKKLAAFLSLFICINAGYSQNFLREIKNFGSNPGNLRMYLHKPVSTADSVKLRADKPLVVVLHGCNQNAESIALQSGWNKLADGFDFYVIYPEQKR